MARGTVVEVDVVEGGTPTTQRGVVIEAKPAGAPTRVKVLWEPIAALCVSEHAWPPMQARILGVADLRVSRASRARKAPAEEPVGFAEFLGAHVVEARLYGIDQRPPGAGTTRRARLAATFARLQGEGYELADFKAASVGVLSDEFMRQGGHTAVENVLRVEKIGRRADLGRQELTRRAEAAASDETDWGAFDGA